MAAQLILGLSILVGVHEFGHLITAKMFGMRAEKFFIGFPPKVVSFMWRGTEYALGAIPLGGFVKISGMVDESMDAETMKLPPQPYEFRSKPAWQRLIVMLGGIIMNVITGILIFTLLIYVNGETYIPISEVKNGVVASDLAQSIGLKTGDKIIAVNGVKIESFNEVLNAEALLNNGSYTVLRGTETLEIKIPADFADKLSDPSAKKLFVSPIAEYTVGKITTGLPASKAGIDIGDKLISLNGKPITYFHELQSELKNYKGKEVKILIDRNGLRIEKEVTVNSDGMIGIQPKFTWNEKTRDYGFFQSIPVGTAKAFDVITVNIFAFSKMFRGELNPSNSFQGPLAIAQDLYGGTWNWDNFWTMTGLLSMALAFMNILPIPALDGGHVMFLMYEIIARRKPSDKFMETAQKFGMIILLSLMAFVIFNDVFKRLPFSF